MIKYQSFELFKKEAQEYINDITLKAQAYCQRFNLDFYIDEEFDFSINEYYNDAIACYEQGTAINYNEIQIALSLKHLFDVYSSTDYDDYEYNLLGDLIVTIFHEIGHGLVEYFSDEDEFPEDGDLIIPDIIWDADYDEEEIVEEFGLSFAPQYTDVNSADSRLRQALEYVAEQIEEQEND